MAEPDSPTGGTLSFDLGRKSGAGSLKLIVGDRAVTLHPYGHIEFEGGVDDAARTFWNVVRHMVPQMGNLPLSAYTAEELRAELEARGDGR